MADVAVIASATAAAPRDYTIPGAQELLPKAVSASMDGSGTASPWFPCMQVLDPFGHVMFSAISTTGVAAGGSADVSWFPGLGGGGGGASVVLPILDLVDFTPAGNKVQITSTNPNIPTTILTGNVVSYDGATTVKVDFYAAAIDLDQRGQTGLAAVLLEFYRDSTALGVVFDFNVNANLYGQTTPFCSMFDVPPAGAHSYSLAGYLTVGGGTLGQSFIYGNAITTAHATRPGYQVVYKAEIV